MSPRRVSKHSRAILRLLSHGDMSRNLNRALSVRLARTFSACLQGALLLRSAFSSNLSFFVFSFFIHVQSSNSGLEKERRSKSCPW